jgi:hypothetical protein
VKQLNKLQASGLIAELLELSGKNGKRTVNGNGADHGRKGAQR